MAATTPLGKTSPAEPWRGFQPGIWQKEIDVRDFIQQNYIPHEGDGAAVSR